MKNSRRKKLWVEDKKIYYIKILVQEMRVMSSYSRYIIINYTSSHIQYIYIYIDITKQSGLLA